MSRYSYAGGAADFVFDVAPNGYLRLRPATLLVYAAEDAGARVTDLRLDGVAVTTIPVDDTGQVPSFQGPDNFAGDLWASTGPDKPRVRLISNAESTQAETAAATAVAAAASIADEVGLLSGYVDHGNVSGQVTIDSTIGTHVLDATGPTLLTISDADNGTIVTVLPITGAANVGVDGIADLELTDDAFATFARIRGVWKLGAAGAAGGAPDATPPSAVTDLTAAGGEGQIELEWTAATDSESTVRYAYRVWLTSGGPTGVYSTTNALTKTITGLTPGAYTAQVYSYSTGGSTAADSATVTVTAPAGWHTLIADNFNAADSTLISGRVPSTTPNGAAWSNGGSDSAHIINNKVTQPVSAGNPSFQIALPAGSRSGLGITVDYALAVQSDTSLPSMAIAFDGGGVYAAVGIAMSGGAGAISATNGGGHGGIALTGTTAGLPLSGRLGMRMIGNTLSVSVDGTEVATGAAFATTADSTVAIVSLTQCKNSQVDNFEVEEYTA